VDAATAAMRLAYIPGTWALPCGQRLHVACTWVQSALTSQLPLHASGLCTSGLYTMVAGWLPSSCSILPCPWLLPSERGERPSRGTSETCTPRTVKIYRIGYHQRVLEVSICMYFSSMMHVEVYLCAVCPHSTCAHRWIQKQPTIATCDVLGMRLSGDMRSRPESRALVRWREPAQLQGHRSTYDDPVGEAQAQGSRWQPTRRHIQRRQHRRLAASDVCCHIASWPAH
jgi:hypothetical protein